MRHLTARAFLALVATLATGCALSERKGESVFAVLPGTWAWEESEEFGCERNSHALTFTDNRKVMLLKHKEPSTPQSIPAEAVRYRVLQSKPNLRMAIEGETRMTPAGEPVVWDLVLLSADRFCWRRTDWAPDACTSAVVRCPVSRISK